MFGKKQHEYKRLPGRQLFRVAGSSSFWMGKDHLLYVENHIFMESYKRFFYNDVQLVTIQRTSLSNLFTIIFCLLLALALFVAMPVDSANIPAWFLAGLFTLLLLFNLWLGPTCAFYIQTAVQTVKITPVQRLRTARRVINLIQPHIEQVQGQLDQESIPSPNNAAPKRQAAVRKSAPEASVAATGHGVLFHQALFLLLIFDGCLTLLFIFANNEIVILGSILLALVLILCVVGALAQQDKINTPEILRKLTWFGLFYVIAGYGLGYMLVMLTFFNSPITTQNQWELVKFIAGINFIDKPWLLGIFSVYASIAFGLGGTGIAVRAKYNSGPEDAVYKADAGTEQELDISHID